MTNSKRSKQATLVLPFFESYSMVYCNMFNRHVILVSTHGILLKMIKRGSWVNLYLIVRGEILGFFKDKLVRKHFERMFSLIKNERKGIEDDQIPL